MSRVLRRRYAHAKGVSREELLRRALRDWRSGRAYYKRGRYWLRSTVWLGGSPVTLSARARVAPWSKAALAEWGSETDGLHLAARAKYPDEERGYGGVDPVAARLVREIAEER